MEEELLSLKPVSCTKAANIIRTPQPRPRRERIRECANIPSIDSDGTSLGTVFRRRQLDGESVGIVEVDSISCDSGFQAMFPEFPSRLVGIVVLD